MAASANRYPLTVFDNVFSPGIMIMGWPFKGTADIGKLDAALGRLVNKWPLLCGRLGKDTTGTTYHISVKPNEVIKYQFTSHLSEKPLQDFIPLHLLPPISSSYPTSLQALPRRLLMHSTVPPTLDEWIKKRAPLICWHVEIFPDGYSCIGMTFHHVWLDGYGVGLVVRRLVQELDGKGDEVEAVPLPNPGYNALTSYLDDLRRRHPGAEKKDVEVKIEAFGLESSDQLSGNPRKTVGLPSKRCLSTSVGAWFVKTARSFRVIKPEYEERLILISPSKLTVLHSTRAAGVSRSDNILAFVTKAVYDSSSLSRTSYSDSSFTSITIINFASIRAFASAQSSFASESLSTYIHNSVIAFPHHASTSSELKLHTLASLSASFRDGRRALQMKIGDAFLQAREALEKADHLDSGSVNLKTRKTSNSSSGAKKTEKEGFSSRLVPPKGSQWLFSSNVSTFGVACPDWKGCLADGSSELEGDNHGSTSTEEDPNQLAPGKSITRFKDAVVSNSTIPLNVLIIVGYLTDGTLLLHTVFSPGQRQRLIAAVNRL